MSLTAIIGGVARNLSNTLAGDSLQLVSDEQRFVTCVTESGAVHTFIVDAEHAAKDGETLVKWVEHTRALAAISPAQERGGPTPEQVNASADAHIGATTDHPNDDEQHEDGGF